MSVGIIPTLLDELLASYAYSDAGIALQLNAGLTRSDIDAVLASAELQAPESYIALYKWCNGCKTDYCGFQFRDTTFLSLQNAMKLRQEVLPHYEIAADEIFAPTMFLPFSHFEGCFYGVQCSRIGKPPPSDEVYCVFEGVEVFYKSIDAMLKTCIDWVREDAQDDEELELEIWRRNNPGVFEWKS